MKVKDIVTKFVICSSGTLLITAYDRRKKKATEYCFSYATAGRLASDKDHSEIPWDWTVGSLNMINGQLRINCYGKETIE